MARPRPTIKRAIKTCARALVAVSHRVPLIGFVVGGALAWLAFWMRTRPPTSVELLNRVLFWTVIVIAACFVLLGAAGFIETISARRRRSRSTQES